MELDYQPWKEYTKKLKSFTYFVDLFRKNKEKELNESKSKK